MRNSILLSFICCFISASAIAGQKDFSAPGTYTFQVPAGVTQLSIDAWGGGGGGGGWCTDWGYSGSGGNGGNLSQSIPVQPGESFTIVIGAGGAGGCSGGGGGGGGSAAIYASSFDGPTQTQLNGGQGMFGSITFPGPGTGGGTSNFNDDGSGCLTVGGGGGGQGTGGGCSGGCGGSGGSGEILVSW